MPHRKSKIYLAAFALMLFLGSEVLAQKEPPRYEIGGQFSLFSRKKPSTQFDEFIPPEELPSRQLIDPGFGARFTCNVTNNIALEAEGNFFPERNFASDESFFARLNAPRGHIFQGQFGVKAGKRFKKVGLFIKGRPGFVGFTKVSQFTGFKLRSFFHPSQGRQVQLENAEFRIGKATYPSVDLGGVVEFYPSRRIVTRLDVGDTIIRYGIYREPALNVCPLCCPCPTELFERPAETRHNLQFSAGIAIRF